MIQDIVPAYRPSEAPACSCPPDHRLSILNRRLGRGGAFGLLAAGIALAHLPNGVGLPCPVFLLTGVPCPLCGMTTSVRNAMGLRFSKAAAANPFGFLVVAAALAVIVLPWNTWQRLAQRIGRVQIVFGIAGLTLASWFFELNRYHLV